VPVGWRRNISWSWWNILFCMWNLQMRDQSIISSFGWSRFTFVSRCSRLRIRKTAWRFRRIVVTSCSRLTGMSVGHYNLCQSCMWQMDRKTSRRNDGDSRCTQHYQQASQLRSCFCRHQGWISGHFNFSLRQTFLSWCGVSVLRRSRQTSSSYRRCSIEWE